MVSRRDFVRLIGIGGVAALAAACGPAAVPPAGPTPAAPPKPADAPKPATQPAPAQPTTAPAAAATQAPAAAAPPSGKLPQVILDPARMPKQFKEAPMLSELVRGGQLPPVEQRLPKEPLVLQPTDEIGKYGGNWRMAFTGPADKQNMERHNHDHLIYWDAKVETIVPHIAKGWDIRDGGKTIVFKLREGMKWSDGHPFTADDFVFWYQDVYLNEDLNPSRQAFMAVGGKQGTVEKIDDYNVAFKFEQPYHMLLDQVASLAVAGHMTQGWMALGLWAPKHYMQQFHPKYVDRAQLDSQARAAGFDNWATYFKDRNDTSRNVNLPTTAPWRYTSPITTPSAVMERNPYFFAVDTEGNQLPYIDKITWTLAENLEVANLRAIAGEYDLQVRHMDIAKLPAFKENERRAGYTVGFWKWLHGTDAGFFINQDYDADPEIARWLTNKDFRIALSLGIDRDQLNEVFWLGQGEPGGPAPAENTPFSAGQGSRKLHSTLDPTQANTILDRLGLVKGPDGMRQRTDGKGTLIITVTTVGAAFVNWTGIAEMVAQHWAKNIGIKANVEEVERSLMTRRLNANELQIRVWSNDGSDNPFTYPVHSMAFSHDSGIGPESGKWYQSGGRLGRQPTGDLAKQLENFDKAKGVPAEERRPLGQDISKLMADNVWIIGTVGVSPALLGIVIRKNNMANVPDSVVGSTPGQTPGNARPEQFFFKS
jgi:peptide/nickel transport system substrate-binding protein